MHPGNHLWMRTNTELARRFEREAQAFAEGLLIDEDEMREAGLEAARDIAEHFGVPEEIVRVQGTLLYLEQGSWELRTG